jgi:hypothetical protein
LRIFPTTIGENPETDGFRMRAPTHRQNAGARPSAGIQGRARLRNQPAPRSPFVPAVAGILLTKRHRIPPERAGCRTLFSSSQNEFGISSARISQIQFAPIAASPVRVEAVRGDPFTFAMTIARRQ